MKSLLRSLSPSKAIRLLDYNSHLIQYYYWCVVLKCTSLLVSTDFPTNDYLDISKFQHSRHGTHTLQHKIKVFVSVSLKFPETWRKEWSRKLDTT